MKAIILAAGRGSRMGSMTEELPKSFAVLNGKRLIDWQVEAIKQAGIDDIAIVVGYKKEKFVFDFVTLFENTNWAHTNMVMSLYCAREWLNKDECIVSYSDIVYESDIVKQLMGCDDDITISYDKNWKNLWSMRFDNPLDDAETFKVDTDGKLLQIGNKTNSFSDINGQYMGLLRFNPHGWKKTENYIESLSSSDAAKLDMTGLLSKLIDKSIQISTVPIKGKWYEVDTQEDLKIYQSLADENKLFNI